MNCRPYCLLSELYRMQNALNYMQRISFWQVKLNIPWIVHPIHFFTSTCGLPGLFPSFSLHWLHWKVKDLAIAMCFFFFFFSWVRISLIKLTCMCRFHYISPLVKNGFNFTKCLLLEILCRKCNFPTVSSAFAQVAVLMTTIPQCVTHKTLGLYIKPHNYLHFPG